MKKFFDNFNGGNTAFLRSILEDYEKIRLKSVIDLDTTGFLFFLGRSLLSGYPALDSEGYSIQKQQDIRRRDRCFRTRYPCFIQYDGSGESCFQRIPGTDTTASYSTPYRVSFIRAGSLKKSTKEHVRFLMSQIQT